MKEIYYYLYDRNKKPVITFCLGYKDGTMAKGVAICSKKDNPCKKYGRKEARNRVLEALGTKKSNKQVFRNRAKVVMCSIPKWYNYFDDVDNYYKSQFNVKPSNEFEKKLFKMIGGTNGA